MTSRSRLKRQGQPSEKTAKAPANAKHIFNSRFELLTLGPGEKWGENVAAQWKRAANLAIEEKLIPADFDVTAVDTNQIIGEINKFDQEAVVKMAKESNW
jgi:hypothetical protein